MPSSWQVECLVARMRSLQNEIIRVKYKDHPYLNEPDTVYDALLAVVQARLEKVESLNKVYSVQKKTIPQSMFNSAAEELERISEVFNYADRVDSARIPFEILRSLSWVANYLFEEECPTIVRLDPDYNYSIASWRRIFQKKKWQKEWQETAGRVQPTGQPPTILLLGFPSPDAGSILMHALAAHEFGHEFAYKWNDEINNVHKEIISVILDQYNQRLQDYISAQIHTRRESLGDVYEVRARYVFVLIHRIADKWLKEIFSDLVAARLVGPAFLAAFDRILLGPGKVSDKYPPSSLRRDLVKQYLKSILPAVAEDPVWKPLLNESAESSSTSDELYRIMGEVFKSIPDRVISILQRVPSPLLQINGTELPILISKMEDHIENLAPPSVPLNVGKENDEANKFWLLMYGAWHFRLSNHFAEFEKRYGWIDEPGKAEIVLGNLLLHSLQSLELRHQWSARN